MPPPLLRFISVGVISSSVQEVRVAEVVNAIKRM